MIFNLKSKYDAEYALSLFNEYKSLGKTIDLDLHKEERSSAQRRAKWLYFTMVSKILNERGETFFNEILEIEVKFTKELLNETFWIGGSYRYNQDTSTIGALADFQISPQMRIGYAYEHYITDLRPYTGGTHEILLMFEVFKPTKRVKSPRYF